ncbi:hypothetical protein N0V90_001108 [Kalmusia sp. IMI 367209]|nr:hypothetical protein N0V90_001108 [Kalmusia sp. IMI 367209]
MSDPFSYTPALTHPYTFKSSNRTPALAQRLSQPTAPTPIWSFTEPIQRTAHVRSKLSATSSCAGSAQPTSASSSGTAKAKPSDGGLSTSFALGLALYRSGFGDARAAREDADMARMADVAMEKGLIGEEVAGVWRTPWHVKGVLELKWTSQIINKYNAENGAMSEEVMELKKAEAIARRKDAEEKKFLEDFFAGRIDGNGNPMVLEEQQAESVEKEKGEEEKDGLNRVIGSKVIKKTTFAKKPALSTISEAPPAKQDDKTTLIVKSAPMAKVLELTPLSGRPSYSEYGYYDLVALCHQRNIMSGGSTLDVRNRLIQDDINVDRGLPREAKNYVKDTKRKRGHEAPVVPNAPVALPAVFQGKKRSREEEEEDTAQEDVNGKKARRV